MKKKILYLAFRFPYPQTDGYKLRVFNYCKLLKELGHDVDLFFIYEEESEYKEYINQAREVFNEIYPIKLGKVEKIKNLLNSFLKMESLQENIYLTKEGKKQLNKIRVNDYDFYFSSYIRMFKYLLKVPKENRIIDFTDSISYHYDDARNLSKGIWNIIHRYEFNKVKKYEHFVLDNCDKRMITSPLDRDYILKDYLGENKNIEIFSQGIDEELIKRSRNYKKKSEEYQVKKLVFLGKMNYYPNEDAVIHFCDNILPKLKNVELTIVGASPTSKVLQLKEKYNNITVTGFVEDPYKYILDADIMIAPMRLGGGIQNKILEGMALGKIVISYKERIKPINGIENYKNIIGVESDDEIIKIINEIEIQDDNIGIEARKLIEKNYLWTSIGSKLVNFLKNN